MSHNPIICAIDTPKLTQAKALVEQLKGSVGLVKLGSIPSLQPSKYGPMVSTPAVPSSVVKTRSSLETEQSPGILGRQLGEMLDRLTPNFGQKPRGMQDMGWLVTTTAQRLRR